MILANPELRALWKGELAAMRERILDMRKALVDKLAQYAPGADFRFILEQRGMFSYTGLTAAQVARLRNDFSVYAVDTGRICVAALNSRNRARGVGLKRLYPLLSGEGLFPSSAAASGPANEQETAASRAKFSRLFRIWFERAIILYSTHWRSS